MPDVKFYENAEDSLLKFAVIAARHKSQWIFCRHKDRNTWEIPGGHREPGEAIMDTARRELYEETGAAEYTLSPISVYSVTESAGGKENRTYGMLYYADVEKFGSLPDYEIKQVILSDGMPKALTYPLIQPVLFDKVTKYLNDYSLLIDHLPLATEHTTGRLR